MRQKRQEKAVFYRFLLVDAVEVWYTSSRSIFNEVVCYV